MKSMRVLGNMIEKLAQENNATPENMGQLLHCTADQVKAMYKGRIFPSFEQLNQLATYFSTTIDALLDGDEQHYKNSVVHCMGAFERPDDRELILDIIDDYLRLKDAVNP